MQTKYSAFFTAGMILLAVASNTALAGDPVFGASELSIPPIKPPHILKPLVGEQLSYGQPLVISISRPDDGSVYWYENFEVKYTVDLEVEESLPRSGPVPQRAHWVSQNSFIPHVLSEAQAREIIIPYDKLAEINTINNGEAQQWEIRVRMADGVLNGLQPTWSKWIPFTVSKIAFSVHRPIGLGPMVVGAPATTTPQLAPQHPGTPVISSTKKPEDHIPTAAAKSPLIQQTLPIQLLPSRRRMQ